MNRRTRWLLVGVIALSATAGMMKLSAVNAAEAPAPVQTAPKDIVDTAVGAGQFKTLAAALKAADLIETLKGPGPFTVFAPTDAAFAKLPQGAVEDLLKPENKTKLRAILTYHVVAGRDMAKDLMGRPMVKTVNGKELELKMADGKLHVGTAAVAKADIEASNGVIHVIDTVLMP